VSAPLVVQLSDPHIGARWADGDPAASLRAVVAAVRRLGRAADAVVLSGDLADGARDAEYAQLRELIAPLACPVHVLAGNHDDRDALHRHFGVPGAGGSPVQYSAMIGSLRLVVLDSTRPGADDGELDAQRLAWLDGELARDPSSPTLVAMHHQPVLTGLSEADRIGLCAADRDALRRVLERHTQVRAIAAGHVHRTIVGELAGRPVLVAPSTFVQARLELASERLHYSDGSPGFAVHTLIDGALVSHVQLIGG